MRNFTIWFAVVAMALAVASPAFAQSSIQGYSDNAGQVQNDVNANQSPQVATTESGGSLPFTGLDVALLAGAGALLAGVGLGMRRLTRGPGTA
jgi:beta-lactamase regulating signal transducer with metallopeptidase domain